MPRTEENVKIINHAAKGDSKVGALAGLLVGVAAGAGTAKAALDRRRAARSGEVGDVS